MSSSAFNVDHNQCNGVLLLMAVTNAHRTERVFDELLGMLMNDVHVFTFVRS